MPFSKKNNQLNLTVRVSPNAKRSGFEGLWNKTHIKIALTAPPVDGKANEFLVQFLSDYFNLKKSAISILSGQTGRIKKVSLSFSSDEKVDQAIQKLQNIL